MTIKLYFETLSEGMHAKLNSRYVPRRPVLVYSNVPSLLRTDQAKNFKPGLLEDNVGRASDRRYTRSRYG